MKGVTSWREGDLWFATTDAGPGAFRRERADAVQAALENERQAVALDALPDRGKKHINGVLDPCVLLEAV